MTRYKTHGATAVETVEVDFEGKAFVITERGAIATGTISSGIFTLDGTTSLPSYRPDRLQREMDAAIYFMGLTDPQREAFYTNYYCVTDTGSTTSVIKIAEPTLPAMAATASHTLHILDAYDGPPRPAYTVDSVSGGDTITLTGAMSEAAPGAGVKCILIAKRKPLPDASDFPNPSFGFKIGSNWFVIESSTGKIWRASLSGSTLSKVASGSGAADMQIGWTAGNGNVTVTHKPRGAWDFSGATFTAASIPVSAVDGAVTTGAIGDLATIDLDADSGHFLDGTGAWSSLTNTKIGDTAYGQAVLAAQIFGG